MIRLHLVLLLTLISNLSLFSKVSYSAAIPNMPTDYKIVAIGDLHGDYEITLKILKGAGLIDNHKKWIGNKTILVQVGDIADRGEHPYEIYNLFRSLMAEAPLKGGQVHVILGNHEIMNIMGNYEYVHEKENGRDIHWSSKTDFGKWVRSLPAVLNIHGNLFSHAGVLPEFSKIPIEKINHDIRQIIQMDKMDFLQKFPKWQSNDTIILSVMTTRNFIFGDSNQICSDVKTSLKNLDSKRMIVGHTPQVRRHVLAKCVLDNQNGVENQYAFYDIDVALSRAFPASHIYEPLASRYIEIVGNVAPNGEHISKVIVKNAVGSVDSTAVKAKHTLRHFLHI